MSHKDAPPATASQVACREFWQREQPHIKRAWGRAKDGSYLAEEARLLHKSWEAAAAGALVAAQQDACVALVADIRFACGDNGKRMQPELVEHIKGLAADATRYQWLRDIPNAMRADHDHNPAAGGWDAPTYWHGLSKPGDELQGPDLDADIDQARGAEVANG